MDVCSGDRSIGGTLKFETSQMLNWLDFRYSIGTPVITFYLRIAWEYVSIEHPG